MDAELKSLQRSIQYLKTHGVQSAIILMPMGSWETDQRARQVYNRKIRSLCDAEQIPLHDFTTLMTDDDFADSDHLTPDGIEKFQPHVLKLSVDFLHSHGMLPAETEGKPR